MRSTIRDVAKKALVSVGTVSRVINNHPGVDPKLKQRVEAAIRALSYRPNARAQSFARDKASVISFILSNRHFSHQVHSVILQGVEEYCEQAGYLVVYTRLEYTPNTVPEELRLPRVLRSHGVADAVILAGNNYPNLVELLDELEVPFALVGNSFLSSEPFRPFDQVRVDDDMGAREAVEYLISLGHRRICYVGDSSLAWFRRRLDVYLSVMAEHGLRPSAQTVALSENYYSNGWAQAERILHGPERPTAIFCGADEIAHAVCDYAVQGRIHVPGELSVIGFNDTNWAKVHVPPLSSVRTNPILIGQQLASMAIEKLRTRSQHLPEVVLPTSLIKRGTVDVPPFSAVD
jgi:LacI family transcriptional regulator